MNLSSNLWSWFFQRIAGLILIVGLAVHFIVLHFATARPVTIEKVSTRFGGMGWIVFDSILLMACVYHALNGLNSIILDFSPSARAGRFLSYGFWLLGTALAISGIAVLLAIRG